MVRGAPDYYEGTALWSQARQRKKSIFTDDLEATNLKWVHGGDGTAVRSLDYAFVGEASLKLTTAAAGGQECNTTRRCSMPVGKLITISLVWMVATTNVAYFRVWFQWYDGTNQIAAYIRHDIANNKWQYFNSSGVWADIPGGSQRIDDTNYVWNPLEMLIDFENNKYVYIISKSLTIDMSAIAVYTAAAAGTDHQVIVGLELDNSGANATAIYVDDINCSVE